MKKIIIIGFMLMLCSFVIGCSTTNKNVLAESESPADTSQAVPSTPPPASSEPSTPPSAASEPSAPPPASSEPSKPPSASSEPSALPPTSSEPSIPPPASSEPSAPPPAQIENSVYFHNTYSFVEGETTEVFVSLEQHPEFLIVHYASKSHHVYSATSLIEEETISEDMTLTGIADGHVANAPYPHSFTLIRNGNDLIFTLDGSTFSLTKISEAEYWSYFPS